MSDPPLTCAILSHPSRDAAAVRLAHRLEELDPIIVTDRSAGPGNLSAALRAWSWADGGYHLVIQDDALPVSGFVASARNAVKVCSVWQCAIAFWMRPWHPDARAHQLAPRGSLMPIGLRDHWPPSVALALPGNLVPGLLQHAEECHHGALYDDDVIGCYLASAGLALVACSPSIVEHDPGVASIINGASRQRRLYRGETHIAGRAPKTWRLR